MSDENNNGRNSAPPGGRQPLTLKPRGAGSVSAGTVKQSFSHGRSKTVVVETKRARTHSAPVGNLAAPSSAEKRVFEPRPAAPPQAAGGPGQTRSYQPSPERRDDRASTTTYRPAPRTTASPLKSAPRVSGPSSSPRNARPPRPRPARNAPAPRPRPAPPPLRPRLLPLRWPRPRRPHLLPHRRPPQRRSLPRPQRPSKRRPPPWLRRPLRRLRPSRLLGPLQRLGPGQRPLPASPLTPTLHTRS